MTRIEALQAIRAFGMAAEIDRSDDTQSYDDDFVLGGNPNVCVQICADGSGLLFMAKFADGEGDDYGVLYGDPVANPVLAALQAVAFASAAGVKFR